MLKLFLIVAALLFSSCEKNSTGLSRYTTVMIKSKPEGASIFVKVPNGNEVYSGVTPLKINVLRNARTPVILRMNGYEDKTKIIKTTQYAMFINDRNSTCYDVEFYGWLLTAGILNQIFDDASKDFCSDTRLSEYEVALKPIDHKTA